MVSRAPGRRANMFVSAPAPHIRPQLHAEPVPHLLPLSLALLSGVQFALDAGDVALDAGPSVPAVDEARAAALDACASESARSIT